MPKKKKIFIIGNSHTLALIAAHKVENSVARRTRGTTVEIIRIDASSHDTSPLLVNRRGWKSSINPNIRKDLERRGFFDKKHDRALFSSLGGNVHNAIGLIDLPEASDFVIPGHPGLRVDTTKRIVPVEQIMDKFQTFYQPKADFISVLRKVAKIETVGWIMPPPPVPSNDHIQRHFEEWFKSRYSAEDLKPASAEFRYKLWLLNNMVLEKLAVENQWDLIDNPKSTVDEDGFLVKRGWSDATHGSPWYGEEVFKQLIVENWRAEV